MSRAGRRICAAVVVLLACGLAPKNAYRVVRPNASATSNALRVIVRLAGNAQYTGTMRFLAPPASDAHELHLEVFPVMREDPGARPFAVQLPARAIFP